MSESLFGPVTLLKKRLRTGVFLKIFKNIFFHGARLVAASKDCQKRSLLENSLKTFFEIKFHWFATIDSRDFLKVLLSATFNFRGI